MDYVGFGLRVYASEKGVAPVAVDELDGVVDIGDLTITREVVEKNTIKDYFNRSVPGTASISDMTINFLDVDGKTTHADIETEVALQAQTEKDFTFYHPQDDDYCFKITGYWKEIGKVGIDRNGNPGFSAVMLCNNYVKLTSFVPPVA